MLKSRRVKAQFIGLKHKAQPILVLEYNFELGLDIVGARGANYIKLLFKTKIK